MNAQKRRAQRAIDAAVKVAKAHNIHVNRPTVISDLYGMRVLLDPAPIVARVSTLTAILRQPIHNWLSREIDVATYLGNAGFPVVPPSNVVPPGPYIESGFGISFWTYVKSNSEKLVSNSVFCSMLNDLHKALKEYGGELPILAPIYNDIPSGINRLEVLGDVVPLSDLNFLKATWHQVQHRMDATSADVQPIHGDSHAGNILLTDAGPLWNDFEDVCIGPIEWDWSCSVVDSSLIAGVNQEQLKFFQFVRLLHATVWGHALLKETPRYSVQIRALLDQLKEQHQS